MKGQFAMTKGGLETFYCVYPVQKVVSDRWAEVWLKTYGGSGGGGTATYGGSGGG